MKEETLFLFDLEETVFADGRKRIPAGQFLVRIPYASWSVSAAIQKLRTKFDARGRTIKIKNIRRIQANVIE